MGEFFFFLVFLLVQVRELIESLRIGNYYIFLMVLTSSLEAPSFNLPNVNIPNTIVQYTYAGTLIATFIMSLGNRVQGKS